MLYEVITPYIVAQIHLNQAIVMGHQENGRFTAEDCPFPAKKGFEITCGWVQVPEIATDRNNFV